MPGNLVNFIQVLRSHDVRVSPAETLDAMHVATTLGYSDRTRLRDGLGMALFYRKDQASYGGLANATHFVAFTQPSFDYGFLAAWEMDTSGIKTRADFDALLQSELTRMESAAE